MTKDDCSAGNPFPNDHSTPDAKPRLERPARRAALGPIGGLLVAPFILSSEVRAQAAKVLGDAKSVKLVSDLHVERDVCVHKSIHLLSVCSMRH